MRRLAVAGILLASCTLVASAQESTGPSETSSASSGNWFTRLFNSDKADTKKAADTKKTEPVAPVDTVASIRLREDIVLNRRSKAILKLREVAVLTNDSELLRKVDELEVRANELYFQHVSGLAARADAETVKAAADGASSKHSAKSSSTDDGARGNQR
jgi:hypothetical protein